MALPELASAAQLIHEVGLPVYAGGRALGQTLRRALLLGADGWAPDAAGALALLEGNPEVADREPRPSWQTQLADYRARAALWPVWVEAAMAELERAMPVVTTYSAAVRERTSLDLTHLLEVASLSLLVDGPGLLDEQSVWMQGLLDARGVPRGALSLGLEALLAVRPDHALAADVSHAVELAHARLVAVTGTTIR